ncbi:MAG: hypothetical protein AAF646_02465 [Pseudomonadota bacterium]
MSVQIKRFRKLIGSLQTPILQLLRHTEQVKLTVMVRLMGRTSGLLVSAICTLSLVLLTFAHRPLQETDLDPDIAAYLAWGGSLSDICRTPSEAGQVAECPACIVAKTIAEVPKTSEIGHRLGTSLLRLDPPASPHIPVRIAPKPPARAPPAFVVLAA